MKKLLMVLVLLPLMALAETEIVDGIQWTYYVRDGKACIEGRRGMAGGDPPAIPESTVGAIVIPDTLGGYPVDSIGSCAFNYCRQLTSVTIPSGVTEIGGNAFYACSGLMSATIPSSVTSIGSRAFYGCCNLSSVTIPWSVTSIGDLAFGGGGYGGNPPRLITDGPKEVVVSEYNGAYSSVDGVLYDKSQTVLISCPQGKTGSVTIPSGVTTIGESAFEQGKLTSVTIPASVKNIGEYAFYGCSATKVFIEIVDGIEWTFTVKDGKVSVGGREGRTAIPRETVGAVVIPSTLGGCPVEEIEESAFEHCRRIESVTVPATVKKISAYAFYGCGWLKTVDYLGAKPEIEDAAFAGTGVEQHLSADVVNVVVSNVIVQYVFNSVQPQFTIPASSDTGFVNIIAEVKGGSVAIPATWMVNYPNFVSKYGSDFTKALTMKSGKKDGAGNAMLVWQDYVAGTDPTNERDVFTASITIVDGKVTISYTPELDDARKAMRKYTTWGKTSLMDTDWTEVQDGHESEYNFFKVSVEMR